MTPEVLLVEDSAGDVRLTQESFRDANMSVHLHVASDGIEAMAFLRKHGAHAHAPRPDLILLDLNLPKMDGREVLTSIKQDESLKTIPTLISTTSVSCPTSRVIAMRLALPTCTWMSLRSSVRNPVSVARSV